MLKVLDISNWQKDIDVNVLSGIDAVICKATEDVDYVDPYCDGFYQAAKNRNLLRGFYHFAGNSDPISEADTFIRHTINYFNDGIAVLDWEGDQSVNWVNQFVNRIHERTNVWPIIYANPWRFNQGGVEINCGRWVASYPDATSPTFDQAAGWNYPSVDGTIVGWQFCSDGHVSGYNGDLDCSLFYIDAEEWAKYANTIAGSGINSTPNEEGYQKMLKKDAAVAIMRHLATDPDHGYSQIRRYGDSSRHCEITIDGYTFVVNSGDRDCSSAEIDAYEAAGVDCGGATYTGNMRELMTATGNFIEMPMSYSAQPGDIYLNEACHTAMCVSAYGSADGDLLAEFSASETGGIDGESGDQTGYESSIHAYYDFPWDCILHCVCEDEVDGTPTESDTNSGTTESYSSDVDITYALHMCNSEWLADVTNYNNANDDGFAGMPYCYHDLFKATVSAGSISYQTHEQYGNWSAWASNGEVCGVEGRAIDGIRAYYTSPNGSAYKQVYYRSQTTERAGYLDIVCDDGTTYGGDDYAGIYGEPLDRIQMAVTDHNPF